MDKGHKTLRERQADEDDEERFQADLKKAVSQSIGIFLCTFYCYLLYICASTVSDDNQNSYTP